MAPELGDKGGEYPALSLECRPSVADAKVVDEHEVAALPWKRHGQLADTLANLVEQFGWERATVGIAAVEGL